MRNLKKFLALTLAMMMVFGLMVTANASSFTDDAAVSDRYTTAVDVLQAIGVLHGYEQSDGSYTLRPGEEVLRQEYAAILYRIHSGDVKDTDDRLEGEWAQAAANRFDDVEADKWYAGYLGYCYEMGLLIGTPDNNYYPLDTITGNAVITGLLRALGYDAKGELQGSNWEFWAQIDANQAGIAGAQSEVKIPELTARASRQMIAQLAWDTLQAEIVHLADDAGYVDSNDDTVGGNSGLTLGAAKFGVRVDEIGSGNGEISWATAKNMFKTLEDDPYGRPNPDLLVTMADEVIYQGYTNAPYEFNTQMAAGAAVKQLRDAGVTKTKNNAKVYMNGVDIAVYDTAIQSGLTTAIASGSGAGSSVLDYVTSVNNNQVEVYVDSSNEVTTVVVINTFAAKLGTADVVAARGNNDAYIVLHNGSSWPTTGQGLAASFKYYTDEFKAGDVITYTRGAESTVVENSNADETGGVIIENVEKAASFEGTISRKTTEGSVTTYTIGGKAYVESSGAIDGPLDLAAGDKGTFWTDNKGQIIYFEPEEEEQDVAPYYIIEALAVQPATGGVDGTDAYVEARLVNMSGVTSKIKVKSVTDGSNTYTGDGDTATSLFCTAESHSTMTDSDGNDVNDDVEAFIGKVFFTAKSTATGVELTPVPAGDADKNPANEGGTAGGTAKTSSAGTDKITKGAVSFTVAGTTVPVNNETVFVVANKADSGSSTGDHTYKQYIGRNDVPNITLDDGSSSHSTVVYLLDKNGIATYVFVGAFEGKQNGDVSKSIFILSTKESIADDIYDEDEDDTISYYSYYAIVNGEIEEIITKDFTFSEGTGLYAPEYDDDGYVTDAEKIDGEAYYGSGYVIGGYTLSVKRNGVIVENFSYDDSTPAYFYGTDVDDVDDIRISTVGEEEDSIYNRIIVVADTRGAAQYVVIIELSDDPQQDTNPSGEEIVGDGFDQNVADNFDGTKDIKIDYKRDVDVKYLTITLTNTDSTSESYRTFAYGAYTGAVGQDAGTSGFAAGPGHMIIQFATFGESADTEELTSGTSWTTNPSDDPAGSNKGTVSTKSIADGTYTLTINGTTASGDEYNFVTCTVVVQESAGKIDGAITSAGKLN